MDRTHLIVAVAFMVLGVWIAVTGRVVLGVALCVVGLGFAARGIVVRRRQTHSTA